MGIEFSSNKLKVRLQTIPYISLDSQNMMRNNTMDCVRLTLKYEGFLGLYKGFLPILFGTIFFKCLSLIDFIYLIKFNSKGVIPSYSTYFLGYSLGLKLQNALFGASFQNDHKYRHIFLAGAFGGAFGDLISIPSERLKCLLQVQTSMNMRYQQQQQIANNNSKSIMKYNGMLDCARHLYKSGGIQSLYKGTLIT